MWAVPRSIFMNISPYKAALSALVLGLSAPSCSRLGDVSAREIASSGAIETAAMTQHISASRASKLAEDVLALDKGEIKRSETGPRASAINNLLNAKGFSVTAGNSISDEAMSSLLLLKAAVSETSSTPGVATLEALVKLPNSKQFSLFSLDPYLMPPIEAARKEMPSEISLSATKVDSRKALYLAEPIFDLFRSGKSVTVGELTSRAETSKNYASALALIEFSLKSETTLPPGLVQLEKHLSEKNRSFVIDPSMFASLEKANPALHFDWQSVGSAGNSIKNLFLRLTCDARVQQVDKPDYLPVLEQSLKSHFRSKVIERPAQNLFQAFSDFF